MTTSGLRFTHECECSIPAGDHEIVGEDAEAYYLAGGFRTCQAMKTHGGCALKWRTPGRKAKHASSSSSQRLPDANPKTRVGAKKVPLHLIPPRAEAHISMAFADGATKYGPYNWHTEKISASVYHGAARRHLNAWWAGEDNAADSGIHHLAHAACCLLMILDTMGTKLFQDNRPPPIGQPYDELLAELADGLSRLKTRPEAQFDVHEILPKDG